MIEQLAAIHLAGEREGAVGDNIFSLFMKRDAQALIAAAASARAELDRSLPAFRACAADYRRATGLYARANARGSERDMLLELGRRAGLRSVRLAQRSEIAWDQARDESRLLYINRQIAACHAVIGVGKIAEAGLGAYGYVASLKKTLDTMKLIIDAVKAAQPVAGEIIAFAADGRTNATAGQRLNAVGQIVSVFFRTYERLKTTGQSIWNHLATIRRATNANDAWTGLAAIAQILKTLVEYFHEFLAAQWDDPEMKKLMKLEEVKGIANGLGILRDTLEACRSFQDSFEALGAMKAAAEAMVRRVAAGNSFIGNENDALAVLPAVQALNEENFEQVLETAWNFNEARLLANAARERARQLASDIAAAATFQEQQATRLGVRLEAMRPILARVEDCLDKLRARLESLTDKINRKDFLAATAEGLIAPLAQERALLAGSYAEVRLYAAR